MNITPLAPLTNLNICSNVGFDDSYDDTVIFESVPEQLAYFNTKTVLSYSELTPVKLYNTIVVPCNADKLLKCDYIYFQNKNFSNKWIFAFIKNIQYINVDVTQITYEVDPIQTFMFDVRYLDSFIERETVDNDEIGKHILPEGIETGPYINTYQENIDELEASAVLVGATITSNLNPAPPEMSGDVFSGLHLIPFDLPGEKDALIDFIDRAVGDNKRDAIVGMVQMPKYFAHAPLETGYKTLKKTFQKHYNDINGFKPRNNKLFCYPYNFLNISNNNGTDATFAYELFNTANCEFELTGVKSLTPEIIMYPKNYKASGLESIPYNYEEKISLNGFPQVSWSSDTFKAYMAQNGIPTLINAVGSIASATSAGAAVGGPAGALVGLGGSTVSNVLGTISQGYDSYTKPPQAHGTTNPSANFAAGLMNFNVTKKVITYNFAKRIDSFFTMYGYKVDRIGKPKLFTRTRFNYIKTVDLAVRGDIPQDDLVKIKSIFNNGIRFWHDTANIGSYALENIIVRK